MTEAARLVDELTTLLYEVTTGWQDSAGGHQIVRCGACRRKADRAESVVHESDCPVYRLIRAEEANTAVIRANAEEIADLEDRRDELEGRVNALTAEMECRNELSSEVARLQALLAERDAEVAWLREAAQAYIDAYDAALKAPLTPTVHHPPAEEYCHTQRYSLRAALAARGGEGQG